MTRKDEIGDLEQTLVELGRWLGQQVEAEDAAGADDEIPDDFYGVLDAAAQYLDWTVVEMGREALGRDVPVEDPRLIDLALTVVSYKTIHELLSDKRHRGEIRGGAREKVGFTVDMLRKQIAEIIADLAEDTPEAVTWSGPDDMDLASFALSVLAADQVAAMLMSFDLVDALEAAGFDPGDPGDRD